MSDDKKEMRSFAGQADQDGFRVTTSSGDSISPQEAIFPIFARATDQRVRLVGTGFFISPIGLFVTAAHVIQEILESHSATSGQIVIAQFKENDVYWRRVKYHAIHPVSDVAVGICEFAENPRGYFFTNKCLSIRNTKPDLEDVVFTYAYPFSDSETSGDEQRIQLHPRFYEGKITACYPEYRDKVLLPGPCYQTNIVMHGGASGGPALAATGGVIGVNSTGFSGHSDISFISEINDIWELRLVDDGGEFRSVREIVQAGIMKRHKWDAIEK